MGHPIHIHLSVLGQFGLQHAPHGYKPLPGCGTRRYRDQGIALILNLTNPVSFVIGVLEHQVQTPLE